MARSGVIETAALHVNHGLSPHAGEWAAQCAALAGRLGVPFEERALQVTRRAGHSLEAEARDARYAALAKMCERRGIRLLLTAHNANDQAETLLLNLVRGTGVAGLAAMDTTRSMGQVLLGRPFLDIFGLEIRHRVAELGLACVSDESNDDLHLTRNALRRRVLPALEQLAPDIVGKLGRSARLAGQAQALLDELGLADLRTANVDANGFDVSILRSLSQVRAANALRTWFRSFRSHAPSVAALEEMLSQLRDSESTARLELVHEGERLHVVRGRLVPVGDRTIAGDASSELRWDGEPALDVPAWGGRLVFEAVSGPGICADWLRSNRLSLRRRQGGERLKLDAHRPSRTLKNLYQEASIPDVERQCLPLLYAGERLVWAAGLGTDIRLVDAVTTPMPLRIALRWEAIRAG